MTNLEERFNHRYNYPYVFLNNVELEQDKRIQLTRLTSAKVVFGVMSKKLWGYPSWYKGKHTRAAQKHSEPQYTPVEGPERFHFLDRFYSGLFHRHPLLRGYEYYWRVEPGVTFHCDMEFDPFAFMKNENKVYSFTISLRDGSDVGPTLWASVNMFRERHPEHLVEGNFVNWITEPDGSYNLCRFWSNFELGRLDFYQSPAFDAFFDHLDRANGFMEEHWGDGPVHTIAAAMFLRPDQIQFWDEIGYTCGQETQCPMRWEVASKCSCSTVNSAWMGDCTRRWLNMFGLPKSALG